MKPLIVICLFVIIGFFAFNAIIQYNNTVNPKPAKPESILDIDQTFRVIKHKEDHKNLVFGTVVLITVAVFVASGFVCAIIAISTSTHDNSKTKT